MRVKGLTREGSSPHYPSHPMVIYFLRHAEAEPDSGADFDRRLTPKGLEQAEKAGRFLVRYGLIPEMLLTSPVVRARQTAKIVAQKLANAPLEECAWLACGMSPESCLSQLRNLESAASILLVGHEPDFGNAIAAMIGLPDAGALKVRKASLTAVDLCDFRTGAGQLQFVVPVRLM